MLKVQRLNMDNSWRIEWDGVSFLIDPWLTGTEVDGFSWFNEQWHKTPPLHLQHVGPFDFAVISQSYPDHFHLETLKLLGNNYPIYAIKSVVKKLKKHIPNPAHEIPLPVALKPTEGIQVYRMPQNKPISTFNGVVILKGNEYLLFAPHGGPFHHRYLELLEPFTCKAVFTTFTLYQLPFFLGGKINPGLESAKKLVQELRPQHVINTHDEDKHAKGISNKIAKRRYPDLPSINIPGYLYIRDYSVHELV